MKSLFLKEVNSFLGNLLGYLIISIFLVALGLVVWVFPETSILNYGYADLEALFVYTPYVFTFLIPALSMRSLAEEKRSGNWEILKTSPLSVTQIIIAKYLALLVLVILAVFPTLLYFLTVYQLGDPVGNLDQAGFFGSWIGLLMIGAVFLSVGLFASSITSQQVLAFVLGVFFCFVLYFGFTALADLQLGSWSYLFEELSLSYHFTNLGRGVLDSSDLFFMLAVIWLFLGLSILISDRE